MKDHILQEIRRLAGAAGGQPPGRIVFERETGIRPSAWRGVFWARWSDAILEAGFAANAAQGRIDDETFVSKLAGAIRHFQRVPTTTELRMYRRADPTFPGHTTVENRFKNKDEMLFCVAEWVSGRPEYSDVAALVGDIQRPDHHSAEAQEGMVYLIQSGAHYKIGRSDELERRVKEIKLALPQAATLVHAIRTDDPPGIEAYWHRRFADRRANGEWFRLTRADVAAFKRRRFQ